MAKLKPPGRDHLRQLDLPKDQPVERTWTPEAVRAVILRRAYERDQQNPGIETPLHAYEFQSPDQPPWTAVLRQVRALHEQRLITMTGSAQEMGGAPPQTILIELEEAGREYVEKSRQPRKWTDEEVNGWIIGELYPMYMRNTVERVTWQESEFGSAEYPPWQAVCRQIPQLELVSLVDANIIETQHGGSAHVYAVSLKLTARGRKTYEEALKKEEDGSMNIRGDSKAVANRTRVFISHSEKDQDLATKVIEFLQQSLDIGDDEAILCTSVPGHKMKHGDHTSTTVKTVIAGADVVIGLLTPKSLKSMYVVVELGAAWGQNVPTCAMLVGNDFDALPGPLKEHYGMRLDDNDRGVSELLELVEGLHRRFGYEKRSVAKAHAAAQRLVTTAIQYAARPTT